VQVKTFEAVDMKQALRVVREQLGPRAVIVSSRSVRKEGGLFGLLGRRVLEVTAATEDEPEGTAAVPPRPAAASAPRTGTGAAGAAAAARTARAQRGSVFSDLQAVKQAMDPLLDELRAVRDSVAALGPQAAPQADDLRSDVAQIRTLLSSLVGGAIGPDAQGAAAQKLFYFLIARGIDEPLARSLVQRVVARVESGGLADLERLKLNLAAEMRADLARATRGAPPSRTQIFVGPTGVGKSTTVAKLAARAAEGGQERVRILTTDMHRIAAVEQMMRFGEVLGIAVDVALSPEDLRTRVAQSDARIFVDTPGRSHREPGALPALRRLRQALPDAELMLVLCAATRSADSREILDAYGSLGFSRLVLTKLDETRVYGELYNAVVRSQRPLACVTTGQSVPEHLESLDIPGILKKVLHG
jgi:flagellar biosynthesis protein FlhF